MRMEGQAAFQDAYPTTVENKFPNRNAANMGKAVELKLPEKKEEPKAEEVQEAVVFANKAMKMTNYHLEFEIHEGLNRYQVRLINNESGETIREIPSDAMIRFAESIRNTIDCAVGILFDELV